ncbi:MAG TPA: acetylglutamate kinase [Methylomirabilota bacterium]|nr:acetylglutamate kinase [Methylomirabilota bacterium]
MAVAPQIDGLMRRVGKIPRFVDGLRVTDAETMELVEMVLVGHVNPELVGLINRHGGRAIGLNGKDSDLIVAHRRPHRRANGECVDLGLVGDVESINRRLLQALDEDGLIPVIAPVATGRDGKTYNVNADHVAGRVARPAFESPTGGGRMPSAWPYSRAMGSARTSWGERREEVSVTRRRPAVWSSCGSEP